MKDNVVLEFIGKDIKKPAWFNAIKCQILLWKNALHELILCIKTIKNEEYIDHGMVSLFSHLHYVPQTLANLNNTDQNLPDFASKNLFNGDNNYDHLPIPVY